MTIEQVLPIAINSLKVRINPYGIGRYAYMADSHLWDIIYKIDFSVYIDDKEIEQEKNRLINYISCLLKFDWERSKGEITGNAQTKVIIITLICCLIIQFSNFIVKGFSLIYIYNFSVYFALVSGFSILMINLSDKWKNAQTMFSFIIGLILGMISLVVIYFSFVNDLHAMSGIDFIVFVAPYLTLLYGSEFRLLTYMNNIRRMVLSLSIISNRFKFSKKLWPFITQKDMKYHRYMDYFDQHGKSKAEKKQNDEKPVNETKTDLNT